MAMGNFAIALGNFEKKANVNMKSTIQKIGMEAFKRVIEKSPVDTGRFRANWGVQIGTPYQGSSLAADKNGTLALSAAKSIVQLWNGQGSIFMCNNLPYSIVLEYGHSKQAPAGMVRTTVAEMGGIATQIAQTMP